MPSLTEEQAKAYITKLLTAMSKAGGSDLFVSKDFPPAMKMQGTLQPLTNQKLTGEVTRDLANSLMNAKQREEFARDLECNFAISLPGVARFRVNVFMQQQNAGMVIRTIANEIPDFAKLGLPDTLKEIIMTKRGLVLVVGATVRQSEILTNPLFCEYAPLLRVAASHIGHVQTRARDSKLRSFYVSDVWFQEAYAWAKTTVGEVHAGKFYRKVGILWDDSFFGDLAVCSDRSGLRHEPHVRELLWTRRDRQRDRMAFGSSRFRPEPLRRCSSSRHVLHLAQRRHRARAHHGRDLQRGRWLHDERRRCDHSGQR